MAEVIVLRTNYYDNTLDKMVRGLKAQTSRRVIAVVDSRTGPIEVPDDISKIVLDPVALGLYAHPEYGWRCGDYALYAALQAVPDISDLWLIEPDVRIHSSNTKAFFDGMEVTKGADFVTAWFVMASAEWQWYNRYRRSCSIHTIA